MAQKKTKDCPLCGAVEVGGLDGCHRLFEQVLAKGYGDRAHGAVHLLTVDAYAL